jgi:hypothetical protein
MGLELVVVSRAHPDEPPHVVCNVMFATRCDGSALDKFNLPHLAAENGFATNRWLTRIKDAAGDAERG